MWISTKPHFLLLFSFMVISGCGEESSFKSTVPVFPASGKILYLGKPLAGVILIFHSTDVNQKIKSQAITTGLLLTLLHLLDQNQCQYLQILMEYLITLDLNL